MFQALTKADFAVTRNPFIHLNQQRFSSWSAEVQENWIYIESFN